PEQMRGEDVDARTDLFSLGAVLYEMATGHAAFEGATAGVVVDAVLNEQPALVTDLQPELPVSLGFVIDKALEKDRALRYQDARGLGTDLLRVRDEIGPAATKSRRRRITSAPRLRRAGQVVIAIALTLVGMILGVALARFRSVPPSPI